MKNRLSIWLIVLFVFSLTLWVIDSYCNPMQLAFAVHLGPYGETTFQDENQLTTTGARFWDVHNQSGKILSPVNYPNNGFNDSEPEAPIGRQVGETNSAPPAPASGGSPPPQPSAPAAPSPPP
jgi:hypothetical protein